MSGHTREYCWSGTRLLGPIPHGSLRCSRHPGGRKGSPTRHHVGRTCPSCAFWTLLKHLGVQQCAEASAMLLCLPSPPSSGDTNLWRHHPREHQKMIAPRHCCRTNGRTATLLSKETPDMSFVVFLVIVYMISHLTTTSLSASNSFDVALSTGLCGQNKTKERGKVSFLFSMTTSLFMQFHQPPTPYCHFPHYLTQVQCSLVVRDNGGQHGVLGRKLNLPLGKFVTRLWCLHL